MIVNLNAAVLTLPRSKPPVTAQPPISSAKAIRLKAERPSHFGA